MTDTLKPLTDEKVLERAIVGALRSAIHDHGPITPEHIGSAAKRVIGNLRNAGRSRFEARPLSDPATCQHPRKREGGRMIAAGAADPLFRPIAVGSVVGGVVLAGLLLRRRRHTPHIDPSQADAAGSQRPIEPR